MKRTLLLAAAIGAFGLAACQNQGTKKSQEQGPQAEQQNAQQQLDQAQSAQKQATDKQQNAEQAQQQVGQKQQELSQAEQNAQQQQQQAQQAQQNAQQQSQQALEGAQRSQEQASREQANQGQMNQQQAGQQGSSAGQMAALKTESGQLAQVGSDQITIQRPSGTPLQLKVNDSTQVMLDGQQSSVSQLPQGAQVRASYALVQDQPTAVKLEVTSKGEGQQGTGGAGSQGVEQGTPGTQPGSQGTEQGAQPGSDQGSQSQPSGGY